MLVTRTRTATLWPRIGNRWCLTSLIFLHHSLPSFCFFAKQRLKESASVKGVDDKDIDDTESSTSLKSSQPRGLLPFAPGQPRTYTLASSQALARLSSPSGTVCLLPYSCYFMSYNCLPFHTTASSSAPRKHWYSAAAEEAGPGENGHGYRKESMATSPDSPLAASLSPISLPHTHTHYMLPIENKGYSPSPSPEVMERKMRQELDREFKYFRGNSNNSITTNSINDGNSSSGRGYGLSSAPSTPSGSGPGLFLDFNASVTRDGYVPADDGSSRDPSPGQGLAAAAIIGGSDAVGSGDQYKHRLQSFPLPTFLLHLFVCSHTNIIVSFSVTDRSLADAKPRSLLHLQRHRYRHQQLLGHDLPSRARTGQTPRCPTHSWPCLLQPSPAATRTKTTSR